MCLNQITQNIKAIGKLTNEIDRLNKELEVINNRIETGKLNINDFVGNDIEIINELFKKKTRTLKLLKITNS